MARRQTQPQQRLRRKPAPVRAESLDEDRAVAARGRVSAVAAHSLGENGTTLGIVMTENLVAVVRGTGMGRKPRSIRRSGARGGGGTQLAIWMGKAAVREGLVHVRRRHLTCDVFSGTVLPRHPLRGRERG